MSDTMQTLRQLHRIHLQLSDLRDRLARGPRQVQGRRLHVARLSEQLDQTKERYKQTRKTADQKELQLKSIEGKVGDLKVKLNQAASNREYQALQDQIAADEMAASVLADEILETIERAEEIKESIPQAEEALATGQREFEALQTQVAEQNAKLEGEVARLEGQLAGAEERLPADIRDSYRRTVRSLGPEALAPVERQSCGGCHQTITNNMYNDLRLGRVIFCRACGRLLYLPEERVRPGG